eukprot:5635376-Pleurochrysis_carterae.AAC.1
MGIAFPQKTIFSSTTQMETRLWRKSMAVSVGSPFTNTPSSVDYPFLAQMSCAPAYLRSRIGRQK